ncbi:hypothetical protein DYB34_006895, partial [Aphanomyces astaci]
SGKTRSRWFALDGAQQALTKYSSSDRSKQMGPPIHILGARIERGADLAFTVHLHAPYRSLKQLKFTAASPDDKEGWMKSLITCINGMASGLSQRMCHRGVLNGQYIFVRELGRGASGVVYLYTYHGKPCAVKKLPTKATKFNQHNHVTDDVKREIALLKKVTNLPHVVSLYDVIQAPQHHDNASNDDDDDGKVYLVMEFLGGGPIAAYDKVHKRFTTKQHMVERDFKRLFRCATIGLKYLHSHQLVHRDIKPDNILMTDDFAECKLADLGVAHWFEAAPTSVGSRKRDSSIDMSDNESTSPPSPGSNLLPNDTLRDTKGTYEFLSPEAISGEEYSGFAADVWALGVTLYAVVVGKLPFQADNVLALFDQITDSPLQFPIVVNEADVHAAVSPLQLKFDMMRRASPVDQLSMLTVDSLPPTIPSCSDAANNPPPSIPPSIPQTHRPHPIDIQSVGLPPSLAGDLSTLAQQLHFQWCFDKLLTGWSYGAIRNDELKHHPLMKPFWELDAAAQARNRVSVEASLKCILALGYTVVRKPTEQQHVPASLARIALSGELVVLGDLLAENDHEVWATEYFQNGWTYAPVYDNATKHHPALVSYTDLAESVRDSTRLGALNILKTLVSLHYVVQHPYTKFQPTSFVPPRRFTILVSQDKALDPAVVWTAVDLLLLDPCCNLHLFPPPLYANLVRLGSFDPTAPDVDQLKELLHSLPEHSKHRFFFVVRVLHTIWTRTQSAWTDCVDRFAPLLFRDGVSAVRSINHMAGMAAAKKCLSIVLQHLDFMSRDDTKMMVDDLIQYTVHAVLCSIPTNKSPYCRRQYLALTKRVLYWSVEKLELEKARVKGQLKAFNDTFELNRGSRPLVTDKAAVRPLYELYHFLGLIMDYQRTEPSVDPSDE